MKNQEFINWIRLIRSENIGPITFHSLIQMFGSATNAIEAIPDMAKYGGRQRKIKIASSEQIEQEIDETHKYGAEFLCSYDKSYPSILRNIDDHPPVLIIRGQKNILDKTSIAIVGSRNSSLNGCNFAKKLASDLGEKNFVVTSGLAKGIDSAAHQATLKTGTIAVIASGINYIYPVENVKLAQEIMENGLIITELPIHTAPKPQYFPQRNRVISGLSKAVAIIEATLASGSLITARMAIEQNRDLFAVPGFPTDPRYLGTNELIKNGAYMLTSSDDIIQNMSNILLFSETNKEQKFVREMVFQDQELIEARGAVKNLLTNVPTNIEQIAIYLNMPIALIMMVSLELELAGKIKREKGNNIFLLYDSELCA